MRAVDCHGFAGGFSLGVVQAGFELVHKVENFDGFGVPLMDGNRHLLGDQWGWQATSPSEWEPFHADLVFGNPPCSGFSNRTDNRARAAGFGHGSDAPVNECMWDLVQYGRRCDARLIIMESVQNAYTQGKDLMLELRDHLGAEWSVTHVLHNNLSCGGFADRRRYFAVFHREPFLVKRLGPNPSTLWDCIGDLAEVPLGAVEGHVTVEGRGNERWTWLAEHAEWPQGKKAGWVCENYRDRLPDLFRKADGELVLYAKRDTSFSPKRWVADKPAPVVTGGCLNECLHPILPRFLTHREVARVMGFPDDWRCQPAIDARSIGTKWWGKGIPVSSGYWIARNAYYNLTGQTEGFETPVTVGSRERFIDTTSDWRRA